jgi:hexosaminidase
MFSNEVSELQALLNETLGQNLPEGNGNNTIEINVSEKTLKPEGYELQVTAKKIILSAADPAGMFYAIQTLRQMIMKSTVTGKTVSSVSLPVVNISDSPAFEWRGLNLDVSRHFFSADYLKKCIDRLALYKFNRLHLHLTDDQGWRVEIKKYPLLTSTGAWRTFNRLDSMCMRRAKENPDFNLDPQHIIIKDGKQLYGGFYTQEQLRDLVSYARSKHVEIIPEIDMPGHMMAAISAYPYLSCSGRPEHGELFSSPLCAGKEEVYSFVEDILTEVIDLFPSRYIHIGADEVDKKFWASSPECREFMKKNGIRDMDELQSYFVQRVQKFLSSKGRETIAWDEALAGGIDPDINIMYWRTWVASVPEKAVANGNNVINSQGDPLYFSGEGNALYNVYHFDVVRKTIPADKAHLIKGAHASVWTEMVPSEKVADSHIFPRIIALSEAVWSHDSVKNWDSFKYRLNDQLARLDEMGINYRYNPSFAIIPITQVDTIEKRIGITFDSEKYRPEIFYTTDGTEPTAHSSLYKGTFYITGSSVIRAAIFADGRMQEPVLTLPADYHKAIGKKVTYHKLWNLSYPAGDAGSLTDGYRGGQSYNDGHWQGFTTDMDVTVDMAKATILNSFSATFMQITGPGVFMPDDVEVSVSADGTSFEKILTLPNDVPGSENKLVFKAFTGSIGGITSRYVRVTAHNKSGHFIFTDEIIIN